MNSSCVFNPEVLEVSEAKRVRLCQSSFLPTNVPFINHMCFRLWCVYWMPCSVRLAHCTALSTHTTTWNICHHNTAKLI